MRLCFGLSSTPLFNDFVKETDEKPPDFDMLAKMGRRLVAISNLS